MHMCTVVPYLVYPCTVPHELPRRPGRSNRSALEKCPSTYETSTHFWLIRGFRGPTVFPLPHEERQSKRMVVVHCACMGEGVLHSTAK